MCGIYGRWHLDGAPIDVHQLCAATTSLRHRGPDDEGYLLLHTRSGERVACAGPDTPRDLALPRIEEMAARQFDLGFGFRRLSILDTSPAGHQPMSSRDQSLWLVFNGEIYNYVELRQHLRQVGHQFVTGTDTEVILAAYQEWGPECLTRFNGMWALAIWDVARQALFLARDRFGIKPLFFAQDEHSFTFASEIKALVGHGQVQFVPADSAVHAYLSLGALPSPQRGNTFFEGIRQVAPARSVHVTREGTRHTRYWQIPAAGTSLAMEAAVDTYREIFFDAVRVRLRSDVPVGTCLSGGVDSSSIVCAIHELMRSSRDDTAQVGDRQQSFSAVYETPGPHNELPHIKRVLDASDAGGNFCVPAVEDLIADLGRVVWHQEEPFQSTSIFAQWCVMRLVRERGITVLLDGQGADEALGGYRPYSHHLAALTARLRLGRALREAGAIDEVAGVSPLPFVARSVALHLPRPAASYLRARKRRARQAGVLNGEFAHQFPTDGSVPVGCGGRDALDNELRLTLEETSLPHLLRHEDRNSMAFSVEARMPFIDFRLVEFSFREALDWKIYQGWTKWILRAAMEDTVPREIIWRRDKVGFETPEAEWTDALVQRRDEYFGPEALSAPYLDLPALRRQLALPRGQRPDDRMIWRSINLEAWLRTWCSRAT